MPCKICKHSDRQAIDAVLLEGWPSLRMIGTQYGVSKDSLLRHYRAHVPDTGDDSGGDEESEARQVVEMTEEKKVPEARQNGGSSRTEKRAGSAGAPTVDAGAMGRVQPRDRGTVPRWRVEWPSFRSELVLLRVLAFGRSWATR